jgi:hypothetical protein
LVRVDHEVGSRRIATRGYEKSLESQEGHGTANSAAEDLTIEAVWQILKLDAKALKVDLAQFDHLLQSNS